MSSQTLIRLGGLAAVLSGALLIIGELLYLVVGFSPSAEVAASASFAVQSLVFLLAGVLLTGGLVGLYAGRSEAFGPLGQVGFLVAFVGTVLVAGSAWEETFVVPALAREAPELIEAGPPALLNFGFTLSFALFSLGWLLFGVAALRARAYPRAAVVLLIVGAVLSFIPLPFTYIVLGLALGLMGLALFSGRSTATQQPARVT